MATYQFDTNTEPRLKRRAALKEVVVRIWRRAVEIDLPTLAAAQSYYFILAAIPFLAVVMTFAVQLLPNLDPVSGEHAGVADLTAKQLNTAVGMVLPPQARDMISHEIGRIQSDPPVAMLSIGILLALWTISNAFMTVISSMNKIYSYEESRPAWKVRWRALLLPILMSLGMISSLVCIIVLPSVISWLRLDAFASFLVTVGQWVAIFAFVALTFGLSYRMAPDHQRATKLITPGSITGALIFIVSSVLFQIYVQNFGSYQKLYGSFGGAVVFLLWCWLTNICLLFGCLLNKTLEDSQSTVREQSRFS